MSVDTSGGAINSVWQKGRVPLRELGQLDATTRDTLQSLTDLLEKGSSSSTDQAAVRQQLRDLASSFKSAQPQFPEPAPETKEFVNAHETWGSRYSYGGSYDVSRTEYYDVKAHNWAEAETVGEDCKSLDQSVGQLGDLTEAVLASGQPLSKATVAEGTETRSVVRGQHAETVKIGWGRKQVVMVDNLVEETVPKTRPVAGDVYRLVSNIQSSVHQLYVVGQQVETDGLHDHEHHISETRSRHYTDRADLRDTHTDEAFYAHRDGDVTIVRRELES